MAQNTAIIFNVQKFCAHDGPGIRTTVFFKGCPLHCVWCHNPEGQTYAKQLLWKQENCTLCGRCVAACPAQAIRQGDSKPSHNPRLCLYCGKCAEACVNNAREIVGEERTIGQLLAEIERDRPFYDQSGGGVTFSGGEAMAQIDFVAELAAACRNRGISVAVDTCGAVPYESFERILPDVDLFLYDIKAMDPDLHRRLTGQDNRQILDNLKRLAASGANINLRLPLIEGVNSDNPSIAALIGLATELRIRNLNLLPYHKLGQDKYAQLRRRRRHAAMAPPSPARMNEIKSMFELRGFSVGIGG
jgi:pyruvate formate lyase activating enzyme